MITLPKYTQEAKSLTFLLLLHCWPALTVAVFMVSIQSFFASFVVVLAVAWSLGGLAPALAGLGIACKTRPLFMCSLDLCLAVRCCFFCCTLTI